jgi:hypothetical protein
LQTIIIQLFFNFVKMPGTRSGRRRGGDDGEDIDADASSKKKTKKTKKTKEANVPAPPPPPPPSEPSRLLGKPLNYVGLQLRGEERLQDLIALTKDCGENEDFKKSKEHYPDRWKDESFFDGEHVLVKNEFFNGVDRQLTCVDCKTNRATRHSSAPTKKNNCQSSYLCLQCTLFHFPGMMYCVCEQCYCNMRYPSDWEERSAEDRECGGEHYGHSVWFEEKVKAKRVDNAKKKK